MKKSRERLSISDSHASKALYYRHLRAYDFARSYCKNRIVLDLGCGDGYGCELLSGIARRVVGVDFDNRTIKTARARYNAISNISFKTADALKLPKIGPFDTIVSFQFIEHMRDENAYLKNVSRVLSKGGTVIFTTPNRKLRLRDGQSPWNEFHVREYSKNEFKKALQNHFRYVQVYGLSARDDLYQAEIKRLKLRRKIASVDIFGWYRKVPKQLSDLVLEFIRKTSRKKSTRTRSVSSKDFPITKYRIDSSLDLVAVCSDPY